MTDLPEKPASMPQDLWEAALARHPQPFSEAAWCRQIIRDWDIEEVARILYENGEAHADTETGPMLAWEEIRDLVSARSGPGDGEPETVQEATQWAFATHQEHRRWAALLVGMQPDDSAAISAIMRRAAAAIRASTAHLITGTVAPPQEYPPGEYAIVELLGHAKLVGRISEVERFGTKMLAMEPLFRGHLLPAVYQNGPSIYRVTPCSPQVAFKLQAHGTWKIPFAIRCTIPAALLEAPMETSAGDELGYEAME